MTCCALILLLASACTTDRTRRAYLARMAAELPPPQRHVIIVPGFGVTRLVDPVTGRHVWGTAHATVQTRFADDLDLPLPEADAPPRDRLVPRGYVGSRGPVNIGWQLTEALRKYGGYTLGRDLHQFFYDWRLSARDNAQRLARFVDEVSPDARADIVTHSAGAMVALAYVKLGSGGDRVDRLIMIAPSRRGVIDAFRIFVRPERFIRRTFTPAMVATWPFVYELLPEEGRFIVRRDGSGVEFDAWKAATWAAVGAGDLAVETHLRRARVFRDELMAAPMPPGIATLVIAGDCVPTARVALHRDDGTFVFYADELLPGEEHLRGVLFEPGDGTVPVSSARAGGEALLFCDGHQGIAVDPNVHRAILRALSRDP